VFKGKLIAAAVALAFAGAAPAQDGDLAKMREEMKQLKDDYEQRMRALEKRLNEAEAKAGKAEQSAAKAEATSAGASGRSGENAFNPAISLILQGTYANESQNPNNYQITGFVPSNGEVAPPNRGFSLSETELSIAGNIDPYFRGTAVVALTSDNEAEVEEAYFQTLALPRGLILKGGRFFSDIGYLNPIHQHAWDFQDAPLAYKAFLGGQLKQDGVQLRWVAPTPFFLELGTEFSSGDPFPGSDRNANGIGSSAVFGHLGGDIGPSYAWRAGLSYLRNSPDNRTYDDVDAMGGATTNSFSGKTRMWIADGVLKWAPNGNASVTNFKLQGEYFWRREEGTLTYNDSAQAAPQFGTSFDSAYSSRQSGWYLQGVYQFMPHWRLGYRHDHLDYGSVANGIVANGLGPVAADFRLLMTAHDPRRDTVMLDWSPTEFSRVRLQLAYDKSGFGATDRQALVQYIFSLGAHGAHRF